jgi:PAS domain S-box-containing protein
VHRFELEIQNEELHGSRLDAEEGRVRYSEIFDHAPIGYLTLGADGFVREANHVAAHLLGVNRPQLRRLSFGGLVDVADRERFAALLGRVHDQGTRESVELTLWPSGRQKRFRARLTAAGLSHPEPLTLLAFEDVTERYDRDERLRRTEQALREADRRKDEFLATLSHELRNPLAPVRSSLYVLSHVELGGEQARRALGVIERQVSHLSRLVEDLLDVTRVSRGKIRLQRARVDLADLVRRTLDDYRGNLQTAGVNLEVRIEDGSAWVDGDPARLTQVLSNLLNNAEKFTPPGGRVTVELRREGPEASVKVRDTGVGIAPELREQLFKPFTQGTQTLDRTRGGLGLGLAMVKGLVELHGGAVTADSGGPGRGAEFALRLPLVEPPPQAAVKAVPAASRRRKVLIIEDNHDAAESLKDALELCGHEVQVAYDGARGIEIARQFQPAIVLCDLGLPGMDGYDVARAFRAEHGFWGVFLVALSGYAQLEDQQRAAQAGFDRHLAKPTSLDRIEQVLAEAPPEELLH